MKIEPNNHLLFIAWDKAQEEALEEYIKHADEDFSVTFSKQAVNDIGGEGQCRQIIQRALKDSDSEVDCSSYQYLSS